MMFTEHGTAAPAPVHHVHHVPPPPATVHPAAAAVAQLALQHAAAPQPHHSALAAHVATAILRATGHTPAPSRPAPSKAQPKVTPRAMQAAIQGALAQSIPQGHSMWSNLGMFDPRAGMQDIVNSISGIGDTVGGAAESPYDWLQSLFSGGDGGYSMQNAIRRAQANGGNGTINVFHPSP